MHFSIRPRAAADSADEKRRAVALPEKVILAANALLKPRPRTVNDDAGSIAHAHHEQ